MDPILNRASQHADQHSKCKMAFFNFTLEESPTFLSDCKVQPYKRKALQNHGSGLLLRLSRKGLRERDSAESEVGKQAL